ncbi:TPA: hypothetical protein N0F65_010438 [Lagenidium giganteum]|uniref:ZSWIM1/3 RNaseH-like domain-containing protein n=1 Tax=Lagenidium giganteum TaxID=4803 RepID=A0AAV2YQ74_9STRA|nr:TPA: hypothetical protein N0F65_010438 [Lagenidium giganteum]
MRNCLALVDDASMNVVAALRSAGAKPKKILQYIQEHTPAEPSLKDVHNLLAHLKATEHGTTSVEARIHAWVDDFADDGNVGRVFTDEKVRKNVGSCITMQTKHMLRMFDLYPEVLLIDATHGANASNYKLFSFMVHDAFGKASTCSLL